MRLLVQGIEWWKNLEQRAKAVAATIACIVAFSGAVIGFTSYFATAASVRDQVAEAKKEAQQQIRILQEQQLETRRDAKDKELFEYEMKARRESLNQLELGRIRQLKRELQKIDEDLKTLKAPAR